MYDHILIPVDFDHEEMSKTAQDVAAKLLNDQGKITLLHVVGSIPNFVAQEIPAAVLEDRRTAVHDGLRSISKNIGANCETQIREGNAQREILNFIEEDNVDCVIIASHKPGLQDYFLGSTAARVVRHAPCPVHVLR